MLRAGDPYFVMDLHTATKSGGYIVHEAPTRALGASVTFDGPFDTPDLSHLTPTQKLAEKKRRLEVARKQIPKIYGGYIDDTRVKQSNVLVDSESAWSLSWGCDTMRWITDLTELLRPILQGEDLTSPGVKGPIVPLSIMDAGAGCGGDTMQFMTANFTDDDNQIHNTFHTVTSVEMDPTRAHYLLRNTQLVRRAYNVPEEPTILEKDYYTLMSETQDDNTLPKFTHDVLYLDPPWGGVSGDDSRQENMYMYSKTPGGPKPYEKDTTKGIDKIFTQILHWNAVLAANNQKNLQTKVIVLKTPLNWTCKMRDDIRRMVRDCVVVGGQRNHFFLFFLRETEAQFIKQVGYSKGDLTKGMCKGFESWQVQETNLKNWFPDFPREHGHAMFTPERPMFLQNMWPDEEKWYDHTRPMPANTRKYIPGQRHFMQNMHNGQAKLLSSSLFTIMYGLKRAHLEMETMRIEYNALLNDPRVRTGNHKPLLEKLSWNHVLENTIVLYIGAGGLSRKTHHFNELLQAIPIVRFVCYDIRHVECIASPANQARLTVFHKMFTENDVQRWASFSDTYPNKNIIIISDIRSDWAQATLECEASKAVLMKKMYQLKLMSEVAKTKAKGQTQDAAQNTYLNKSHEGSIRSQIDQLAKENRAAHEWIDEIVKRDCYVQWDWCALLCNKQVDAQSKPRTTCAVFSVKTREPYQTVRHADRALSDFYFTVPGLGLLQKYTRNSTETRNHVTSENYALRYPRQYSPPVEAQAGFFVMKPVWHPAIGGTPGFTINTKTWQKEVAAREGYWFIPPRAHWSVLECINQHFRSRGDANSFATERVDYQKSLGDDADAQARFRHNPTRSVVLHDMYFAYYNEDWNHTHQKKAVDDGIQHMFKNFYTELRADNVVFEWTTETLANWCRQKDADLLAQPLPHKRELINLDSMINKDDATNTTMMIRSMRLPPAETKKWDALYLSRFFSTEQTLLNYDWHLLWQAKIAQNPHMSGMDKPGVWDQSQEAMEALLVLNMNLGTSTASKNATTRTMLAYKPQSNTGMQEFIKNHRAEFIPPPSDWFAGQLRFNLTRPFVAELYASKHLDLKDRYNHILEYMDSQQVLAQMIPPTNSDADGNMAIGSMLASKPGSAATDFALNYMHRIIQTAYTHAKQQVALPRDWYCYWLQPLLLNRDAYTQLLHTKLNGDGGMQQLLAAVDPFMVWQGTDKGYGLMSRRTDPTTHTYTQDVLQLEEWPQGKPVLFYACEQGCLSMLELCLYNLTPEAIKRKINRPRMLIMKKKDVAHINPDESAAYNDSAMTNEQTRKKQDTVGLLQAENYPLHIAAWQGQLSVVKRLCVLGADHRRRNFWGETPAQCAHLALSLNNTQDLFEDNELRHTAIRKCIRHLNTVEANYAAALPSPRVEHQNQEIPTGTDKPKLLTTYST